MDELPTTLDGTYEQTLRAIEKEKQGYAHRLFQCLVVSARPLHVEELAEIFAIQPNEDSIPTFNSDWRPEKSEEAVLSACSTLVAIVNVKGKEVVEFSHFSVKEYLTSDRIASSEFVSHFHILQRPAHTLLARACLSVLLQLDDRMDKIQLNESPLAPYAAQHWIDHARFENVSSEIEDGMGCLFDKDKPYFAAWIWVYDVDDHYTRSAPHRWPPDVVPLYYAALCGFRDIAEHLIDANPEDINAQGGMHVTPLHAAVEKGHLNIALLLLDRGADVECHGRWLQTPLHVASRQGYADIVQSLIDRGADLEATIAWRETPLYAASNYGNLGAARVLLDHGADVNHASSVKWTPLHAASSSGHYEVTRLLLDRGALVNALERDHEIALHLAAKGGHLRIVELLLKYGANPHFRDRRCDETPLQMASRRNHLEVVRLLSGYTYTKEVG